MSGLPAEASRDAFIVSSNQHVRVRVSLDAIGAIAHGYCFGFAMAWWHMNRQSVNLTALDCVKVRSDGDEMPSSVRPAIRERVSKIVEIADSSLCASSRLDLLRLLREVEPRRSQSSHRELQSVRLIGH